MSASTPRYGITYPTGSDLVSQAPTQFESMADTIETALANVDDRQTENAVKPVVRSTLAQLADASAVTGQTGYVTADSTSANNGAYVYNGSAWVKYAMKSDVDDLADQITQGYGFQRADAGIVLNALAPNGTTNQNLKWPEPFVETPTVVGWYSNDNIYSCSVTNVTKTGATVSVKNVGESRNAMEGHVYAVAWGKLR